MKKPWEETWESYSYEGNRHGYHEVSVCFPGYDHTVCVATVKGTTEEEAHARAAVAASGPDAVRVLMELEWRATDDDGQPYCILCGGEQPVHWDDCLLDALLKKARVRE